MMLAIALLTHALAPLAAQSSFGPQKVITEAAQGANSVHAVDIDSDGDVDVLSSSKNDNKIAWYQNLGAGVFAPEATVSTLVSSATDVYGADVDGDGDQDVLATSSQSNEVLWFQNHGGSTVGWSAANGIASQVVTPVDVVGVDIDGDGDLDVICAAQGGNAIQRYQNLDSVGGAWATALISNEVAAPHAISVADMDGDGDLDVVAASYGDNRVIVKLNDGAGGFAAPQVTVSTAAQGPESVFAADLTEDGTPDILSASSKDNAIAWYENLGEGVYGAQQVISQSAITAFQVFAADLDMDGDNDVMSASEGDDKIAWYQNFGAGVIGSEQVVSASATSARDVFAADLNGDTHLDLLSASFGDNKVAWYESFLVVNPGEVRTYRKLSANEGGLGAVLDAYDGFGKNVGMIGDLDGDGVTDLAVSARSDDDGGFDRGAVWILFMLPDGTIKSTQKISDLLGGFSGDLDDLDYFGDNPTGIGDLDGDGVSDLAVSAVWDDDGGIDRGAVWILFLHSDGTVKSHKKINSLSPGLFGQFGDGSWFGGGLSYLGDLQGDGIPEIAVGATKADGVGALWILSLDSSGDVLSSAKIGQSAGGFTGVLGADDRFGVSASPLGDLDGNGIADIAVGAFRSDDGGIDAGAVWILMLDAGGSVLSESKISELSAPLGGLLEAGDHFGISMALLGDVNDDGMPELAVGAREDDDGGDQRGAVWTLSLGPDASLAGASKISSTEGGFFGPLDDGDRLGVGLASTGAVSGDGTLLLAVGADMDDDGATDAGAVWILFLEGPPVSISTVEGALAQYPDDVAILGSGFDGTLNVLLGGVPEPIISVQPNEIIIHPAPGPPGFVDVTIEATGGTATKVGALRLWPTLGLGTTGIGGTLDVELDNGEPGLYALALATGSLASPIPIASPPTWYGVLLDPFGPLLTIGTGAFATGAPLTLAYPVPSIPALAGQTFFLQAWCQQGFFGPDLTYSFTNLGAVTF